MMTTATLEITLSHDGMFGAALIEASGGMHLVRARISVESALRFAMRHAERSGLRVTGIRMA